MNYKLLETPWVYNNKRVSDGFVFDKNKNLLHTARSDNQLPQAYLNPNAEDVEVYDDIDECDIKLNNVDSLPNEVAKHKMIQVKNSVVFKKPNHFVSPQRFLVDKDPKNAPSRMTLNRGSKFLSKIGRCESDILPNVNLRVSRRTEHFRQQGSMKEQKLKYKSQGTSDSYRPKK